MSNTTSEPDKRCPDCSEVKPASQFGRNSTLPGALSFYCRTCMKRRAAEHYRRKRAANGFTVRERDTSPDGHKRCANCRSVKPVSEFHKQRTQTDGLTSHCKDCRKAEGRARHLKKTYGLTEKQLAELIHAQLGVCAVCRRRKPVHVDHDHTTGEVRGVLCFPCNAALGQLQDDTELFRNAIDYLERTRTTQWQRTLVCTGVFRLRTPHPGAAASVTS